MTDYLGEQGKEQGADYTRKDYIEKEYTGKARKEEPGALTSIMHSLVDAEQSVYDARAAHATHAARTASILLGEQKEGCQKKGCSELSDIANSIASKPGNQESINTAHVSTLTKIRARLASDYTLPPEKLDSVDK